MATELAWVVAVWEAAWVWGEGWEEVWVWKEEDEVWEEGEVWEAGEVEAWEEVAVAVTNTAKETGFAQTPAVAT